METFFTVIGVMAAIFGLIALPTILKGGKDGSEAASGVVKAIALIVAFSLGSWLLSVVFVGGLEGVDHIFKSLGIPFYVIFILPLVAVFLIGIFSDKKTVGSK